MLGEERFEQRPVLLTVLPRQDRVLRQDSMPKRIEASNFIVATALLRKRFDILHDAHLQNSLPSRRELRPRGRSLRFSRSRTIASLSCASISALNTAD